MTAGILTGLIQSRSHHIATAARAGEEACKKTGSDSTTHSHRDHKEGRMAEKTSTAVISIGGCDARIYALLEANQHELVDARVD